MINFSQCDKKREEGEAGKKRRNCNGIAQDASKYVIVKCSLEMLESSPDESQQQANSRAVEQSHSRALRAELKHELKCIFN